MRFLAAVLGGVLCAGLLAAADSAMANQDRRAATPPHAPLAVPAESVRISADASPSPQRGSVAEEAEYARREEASPDVQDYRGGSLFFLPFGLIPTLIIIAVLILLRAGRRP